MPDSLTASSGRSLTASGRKRLTASRRTSPLPAEEPRVSATSRPSDLRRAVTSWISDGKAQGWSPRTVEDRLKSMERFCWWMEHEASLELTLGSLTPHVVREFLTYAREPRPGGRYGSPRRTASREARPATVNAYFRILRAFTNWCLAEELLTDKPLKNVKAPRVPVDEIQPLNSEQVQALIDASRRMEAPERNAALIFLLVDTGLRISEAIGLRIGDVDRGNGSLTVIGKGNKKRTVYMATTARRALWRYLEAERRLAGPEDPLFVSVGGNQSGGGLGYSGCYEVVRNAGKLAGLPKELRSSPHTLRHTFAVSFLRAGGNLFELQRLMGHTDLTVLRRYVTLAEADLVQAHRAASPADRMKLK